MNDQEAPIKEKLNPIEEGLNDLSVTDEQASTSCGGTVNFAAIKLDYREQKPD